MNVPQALSRPHPPIMIGGGEELERLSGLGIDAVLGWVPGVPDLAVIDRFATDVIPVANKL